MGKINVVLPGGQVAAVDEETYLKATSGHDVGSGSVRQQGEVERGIGQDEAAREEKYSGFGRGLEAAAVGFADTITFGAASQAAGMIGGDEFKHDLEETVAAHPYAYGAGSLASMVVPFGATGLAEGAGSIVERGVLEGLSKPGVAGATASGMAKFAARSAGRFAEGAVFGVDGELAKASLTGDPLTIESFVEGAGLGGIMNVGIGAMADGLGGLGNRFIRQAAEREAAKGEFELAEAGEKAFKDSRAAESYAGLRDAVHSLDDEAIGNWETLEKQVTKYESAVGDEATFGKVRDEFSEVQGRVREELIQGKRSVKTVAKEAERDFLKANPKPVEPKAPELEDLPKPPGEKGGPPLPKLEIPKELQKEITPPKYPKAPELPSASDFGMSAMDEIKAGEHAGEVSKLMGRYKAQVHERDIALAAIKQAHLDEIEKIQKTWKRQYDAVSARNEKATVEYQKAVKDHQTDLRMWETRKANNVKAMTEINQVPAGSNPETARLAAQHLDQLDKTLNQAAREWKYGSRDTALNMMKQARAELVDAYGSRMHVDIDVPEVAPVKRSELPPKPKKTAFPKDLKDFARARPETVSEILNKVKPEMLEGPLGRLQGDLGITVEEGASPQGVFSAVHRKLNEYSTVIDKLEAAKEAASKDKTTTGVIRKWIDKSVRQGIKNAAGFKTFKAVEGVAGGTLGAAAAGAVRTGVGGALGYISAKKFGASDEQAGLAAVMASGKLSMGARMKALVAKYALPGSRAIARLGPVTSFLHTRFLSHEQDKHEDPREAAKARIGEVLAAARSAPDTGYSAVSELGMMGHPGDLGFKTQQQYVKVLQHLADTAPKDPGTAMDFRGKSSWTPTWAETFAWLHRVEAATDPLRAIARVLANDSHPAAVETLYYCHPAITGLAAEELLYSQPNIPYEKAGGASRLLGIDTGIQQQAVALSIQGLYLPKPEQSEGAPQNATEAWKRPSAGRPAAVGNNPVAGSSPSLLTQSARS